MGTPNDQAVLQAIFNPNSPFGDIDGIELGEDTETEDEGEYLALETSSGLPRGVHEVGRVRTPFFHQPEWPQPIKSKPGFNSALPLKWSHLSSPQDSSLTWGYRAGMGRKSRTSCLRT